MRSILSFGVLLSVWAGSGIAAAQQVPSQFGPYAVTRQLPGFFANGKALTFSGNSLYVLRSDGTIDQVDPVTGGELANWTIPGLQIPSGDENVTGLATDGTFFWLATYGTQNRNYIRQMTLGASPIVTINQTWLLPNWPNDLALVDGHLVYPQYLGPICEFDPASGQTSQFVAAPSGYVRGLTYDGQYLLAGDGVFATLWRLSAQDGAILETWEPGLGAIFGLSYDPSSGTLYIGSEFGVFAAVVPEPGVGTLAVLGGLLSLFFRRRD